MKLLIGCALVVLSLAGCKTVVTTTTEIRPSRYAAVEFTRRVMADSAFAYALRALEAEGLKIQKTERSTGTLVAGPVKVPAADGMPVLDAQITVTTVVSGPESTVRIVASATLEQNQQGGTDPRLMAIVQRVQTRMDALIGH